MKKIFLYFIFVCLFTSCGLHQGLTNNTNIHSTEVVLSQRNFRVVSNVKGESNALYVLGIGGFSTNAMIAEAKAQMLSKADMIGKSRAIINETVEVKNSFYLIAWTRKVTVTAQVIEFMNTRKPN